MIVSYSVEKLKELLKDFYLITGMKICLFDLNFKEILTFPEEVCGFCSYIRKDKQINSLCENSDRMAFKKCAETKMPYLYNCHMGITEGTSPIIYNDILVGYMMFGQFLPNEEDINSELVIKKLSERGLDAGLSKEKYFEIKKYDKDKIKAAAKILEACAGYVYLSQMVYLRKDSIIIMLENYIEKNIAKDIKIEDICRSLNITKTKLYEVSRAYYGKGLAKYIKEKRLLYACKMLKEGKKNIMQTAFKCGIADYNYFTKLFKKEYGITPKKYQSQFDNE